MLTQTEFEQIKTAVEMSCGYHINGYDYIMASNVVALLWKYTDQPPIEDKDKSNVQ